MTSLLVLKNIYALAGHFLDFVILLTISVFFTLAGKIDGTWILLINLIQNHCVNHKICLVLGNNEYFILCNFGDRSISGFEVIWGTPPKPPPFAGKPGLNRATI